MDGGATAGWDGTGEANEGAAMVSATASALRPLAADGAAIGTGGIAGSGSGERPRNGPSGQDGAMNGAGVTVVTDSSKCSGAGEGRGFGSASTRGAAGA